MTTSSWQVLILLFAVIFIAILSKFFVQTGRLVSVITIRNVLLLVGLIASVVSLYFEIVILPAIYCICCFLWWLASRKESLWGDVISSLSNSIILFLPFSIPISFYRGFMLSWLKRDKDSNYYGLDSYLYDLTRAPDMFRNTLIGTLVALLVIFTCSLIILSMKRAEKNNILNSKRWNLQILSLILLGSFLLNWQVAGIFHPINGFGYRVSDHYIRYYLLSRIGSSRGYIIYADQPVPILTYCVHKGMLHHAKVLIENMADPNVIDKYGGTALQFAQNREIAQLLIDHGACLRHPCKGESSRLISMLQVRAETIYPKLIGNILGAIYLREGIQERDTDGCTALHLAADVEVVRFLVERGLDINSLDNNGNTPLHAACRNTHMLEVGAYPDIAWLLVKNGAGVNAKNADGLTPLHYAVRHVDTAKMLLRHGANVNERDNQGRTPLFYAHSYGNSVNTLIMAGADQNDYGQKSAMKRQGSR